MDPGDIVCAYLRDKYGIRDGSLRMRRRPQSGQIPEHQGQRDQPPEQSTSRQLRLFLGSSLFGQGLLLRHLFNVSKVSIWVMVRTAEIYVEQDHGAPNSRRGAISSLGQRPSLDQSHPRKGGRMRRCYARIAAVQFSGSFRRLRVLFEHRLLLMLERIGEAFPGSVSIANCVLDGLAAALEVAVSDCGVQVE